MVDKARQAQYRMRSRFITANSRHDGFKNHGYPDSAQVAELVDAQASGACGRKVVEVRVFSWAPIFKFSSG